MLQRDIDRSPKYIASLLFRRLLLPILGEALLITLAFALSEVWAPLIAFPVIVVYPYYEKYIDPLINYDDEYSCLAGFMMFGTQVIVIVLAVSLTWTLCRFFSGWLICVRNYSLLAGLAVIPVIVLWFLIQVWRTLETYR